MIETVVYEYLKSMLPDEEVETETPSPLPDQFITIEKTGSSPQGNRLMHSTFAIQSWSTTKAKAAALSEKVCKAMNIIAETTEVSHSEGGDYDFTDTTTKRYRYQAVYELIHF